MLNITTILKDISSIRVELNSDIIPNRSVLWKIFSIGIGNDVAEIVYNIPCPVNGLDLFNISNGSLCLITTTSTDENQWK